MCIGEKDVKWASHDEVVTLIKNAGDALSLKLVTPMDRNYLKVSVVSSLVFFFFHTYSDTIYPIYKKIHSLKKNSFSILLALLLSPLSHARI